MAARRKSSGRRTSGRRSTTRRAATSGRQRKQSFDGNQLLIMELQQIHSAESQLARVLPRMMKPVQSDTLREMLEQRLQEGEQIIEEVEAALEEMDERPGRRRNAAAEGLVNDAKEHLQMLQPGPALDSVLIAAIQKTEHYCIAAWGTARALAQATGQRTAVRAMERALKEGRSYDEQLTQLAENEITPALLSGAEESEEGRETMTTGRGRARLRREGLERRIAH